MIIHFDPPITELRKAEQLKLSARIKTRDNVTRYMGWRITELRGDEDNRINARLRTLIEGGRNG